ncbi:hypothetical protein [Streptomyces umbrinus]|uniref:hypothetical protein n=1 Tax=Streptomyces umbrinus TaxID=67370 RepID=UPI003C2B71B3
MSNVKVRLGALTGVAALAAGLVVAGAIPAAAEDSFTFGSAVTFPSGNVYMSVRNNTEGATAGTIQWWADPDAEAGTPGDTLVATDSLTDGYGIEAHLSTGRVASTEGHSAPYTVQDGGNLTEGNKYTMWVCVVKGTFSKCSGKVSVTA